MKNALLFALLSSASFGLSYAHASCGVQSVTLSSGKTELAQWDVMPGEMREFTLPNGFHLGLQIEPASEEKHIQFQKALPEERAVELVKITLFDLTTTRARQLTHTYGGANSIQGYGPKGGADRVVEVGDAGIRLVLTKPGCSKTDS